MALTCLKLVDALMAIRTVAHKMSCNYILTFDLLLFYNEQISFVSDPSTFFLMKTLLLPPFRCFSKFFLDRKVTVRTNIMYSLSRFTYSLRPSRFPTFSGQSRGKQCSFMSLSALLTAQTIPVNMLSSGTRQPSTMS